MAKKLEQNDIGGLIDQGIDLEPRWESILGNIASSAGFIPDLEVLRKSEWWKSGKIGAVHCPGAIKRKGENIRAVLKIQGTKPSTSEVEMINAFGTQNKSNVIRPPKIYLHLPWNEKDQFEVLLLEEVSGKPVIMHHPATDSELDKYFDLYEEYRVNCLNDPWVTRPKEYSYKERINVWKHAVSKESKNDPLKKSVDNELTEEAIVILEKNIGLDDLEFAHGHYQPGDLLVSSNGDVVIFSNLYWGWRNPFYDAVFGYHWWMLGMEHSKNLTESNLEKERERWFDKLFNLSEVKSILKAEKMMNLALLERAVPALMVDRYFMDQTKPSAEIITKGARKELKRLISILS